MTAKITLDRTRSYGSVHGEDTGGAFFEQDGILFDNDGYAIDNQPAPNFRQLADERERKMAAQAAAKKAYAAVMAGEPSGNAPAGAPPAIVPDGGPPPADGDDDTPADEVDLLGWITGKKKYQFFAIQGALIRQKSFKAQSKAQAVEFLIENLQLQPEDIKV